MLLVARAAPMAIMALAGFTCAPASETFKLPGRRMLEPISLRFDPGREKEAACRRFWCERPEASLCHRCANSNDRGVPALRYLQLPWFITYGPPRRTNSSVCFRRDVRRAGSYYA